MYGGGKYEDFIEKNPILQSSYRTDRATAHWKLGTSERPNIWDTLSQIDLFHILVNVIWSHNISSRKDSVV